jgi:hypothetical protein
MNAGTVWASGAVKSWAWICLYAAVLISMSACPSVAGGNTSHTYVDPQVGIEAFRYSLPRGWKADANVQWNMACPSLPAAMSFRAVGPSDDASGELLPLRMFSYSSVIALVFPPGSKYMNPCNEVQPPMSAVEAAERIVIPRLRGAASGVRIVESGPAPPLRTGQSRCPGASEDTKKVRIAYTEHGVAFEEDLMVTVCQVSSPTPTGPSFTWTLAVGSARARQGRLDAHRAAIESISASFKPNPKWQQRVAQISSGLTQGALRQQQQFGEASSEAARQRSRAADAEYEHWKQDQARKDRMAEEADRTIRGVEKYYDPGKGEAVELPQEPSRAWQRQGEYQQSSDPSYDPNMNPNDRGGWEEMQKAE